MPNTVLLITVDHTISSERICLKRGPIEIARIPIFPFIVRPIKNKFLSLLLILLSDSESRQHVYHILEELGLPVSPEDAKVVKEVCHTVTSRAAMMCAAGVAAVVEKIRENKRMTKLEVTVGVDGTVYKMNP